MGFKDDFSFNLGTAINAAARLQLQQKQGEQAMRDEVRLPALSAGGQPSAADMEKIYSEASDRGLKRVEVEVTNKEDIKATLYTWKINIGLNDEQLRCLTAELPSFAKKTKDYGSNFPYVDFQWVATTLNRTFGFNGWSTQTTETNTEKRTNEKGRTEYECSVRARLTIHGERDTIREDCGTCTNEKLDTALKGAVSDAYKRCAATLGPQFTVLKDNPTRQDARYWIADERVVKILEERAGRKGGR